MCCFGKRSLFVNDLPGAKRNSRVKINSNSDGDLITEDGQYPALGPVAAARPARKRLVERMSY